MSSSLNFSVGTLKGSATALTTRVRLVGAAVGRDTAAGALSGAGPSPSGTVVTWVGLPGITNSFGEVWTITSVAKIAVNGVTDPVTANVIKLAYVSGLLWQLNTAGNWYSKPRASAPWSAATRISPLPVSPALAASGSSRDSGTAALATAITLHGFSATFSLEFQT